MAEQSGRWRSRPIVATVVRIIAFVLPFAAGLVAAQVFVHLVARPADVGVWPWRGIAAAVAIVAALVVDPLARRLLPLAALLQMALLFPDRAPSRLGLAARVGSVRDLKRLLAVDVSDHDAAQAARHVLLLAAALSRHDRITRGHSERVRGYASLIAEELRLGPEDADRLQWAALLHDVGKLRIAPEILNKRGPLTSAEWVKIRTHPMAGAHLIVPLADWLGPWAHAVAQHHERFDGMGYPKGLAGSDISLGGRVVAVIDAYDVMTAARSYKRPIRSSRARAELVRCAGGHFDPVIVEAFMNIARTRLRFAAGPLAGIANMPLISSVTQGGAAVSAGLSAGALPSLGALAIGTALSATPGVAGATTVRPEQPVATSTMAPAASAPREKVTPGSPTHSSGHAGGPDVTSAVPKPEAIAVVAVPLTHGKLGGAIALASASDQVDATAAVHGGPASGTAAISATEGEAQAGVAIPGAHVDATIRIARGRS